MWWILGCECVSLALFLKELKVVLTRSEADSELDLSFLWAKRHASRLWSGYACFPRSFDKYMCDAWIRLGSGSYWKNPTVPLYKGVSLSFLGTFSHFLHFHSLSKAEHLSLRFLTWWYGFVFPICTSHYELRCSFNEPSSCDLLQEPENHISHMGVMEVHFF